MRRTGTRRLELRRRQRVCRAAQDRSSTEPPYDPFELRLADLLQETIVAGDVAERVLAGLLEARRNLRRRARGGRSRHGGIVSGGLETLPVFRHKNFGPIQVLSRIDMLGSRRLGRGGLAGALPASHLTETLA